VRTGLTSFISDNIITLQNTANYQVIIKQL
jgi:hypothetical protein